MRSVFGFVWKCIGVSLLGAASIGGLALYTHATAGKPTAATAPLNSSAGEQYSTAELFSRLIARHHWQETHLDRLSVIRTYKVENGKEKVIAEEVVVVDYKAPKTETFTSTSGNGSGFVRHHVFQRLMKNEKNRLQINKDPDSLINPDNYTLEAIGIDKIGSSDCSVVHLVPKRRERDLFEGKMWIDNQDFAVVKITGHLAKSPSFWVKRVDFVRDYQKIDGFWLLSREEAVSAVRMFGKETLSVDYDKYVVNGTESSSISTRERGVRALVERDQNGTVCCSR